MKKNNHFKKVTVVITSSILGTVCLMNHSVATHAAELQQIQNHVANRSISYLRAPALRFLEGYTYYDENNDGQWDYRLSNVQVELIGSDGSVFKSSTNNQGYFYFEGMNFGDFEMRFFIPVVDDNGVPSTDVVRTTVSVNRNIVNRINVTVTPLPEESSTEVPTTEVPTTEAPTTEAPGKNIYSISDFVWNDKNKNGVQDTDEIGISGVTVILTKLDGTKISVITDQNGHYIFTGLENGEYTVEFVVPDGFEASPTGQAPLDKDSNGKVTKVIINNSDDDTVDMGMFKLEGGGTPTTEVPTTEEPTTEEPTTEEPTTEVPTTEVPTTEEPTTEEPTTEEPTTEVPTTEVPTTEEPTTEVPTTEVPTTEEPTTEVPTTEVPTTEEPTTEEPTTEVPTTEVPTTEVPTTEVPTTEVPTTEVPTTEEPTTEVPTTEVPTTEVPTTEEPTTEEPTTERSAIIITPTPSSELPSVSEQLPNHPGVLPPVDNNDDNVLDLNSPNIDIDIPETDSIDINVTYQPTGTIVPDNERIIPNGDVKNSIIYVERDGNELADMLRNPYQPLIEYNVEEDKEHEDELDILIGLSPIELPLNRSIVDKDHPLNNAKDDNQNNDKQKLNDDDKEDIEVAKTNNDKSTDNHHLDLQMNDFTVATVNGPLDIPDPALPTFISGLGGFSF